MAQVIVAEDVAADFDRIFAHLEAHESADGPRRLEAIFHALDVLETSPLIGRPVERGLRELVIGRRTVGSIALYRYDLRRDRVVVLAVRAQREAGYRRR